MLIAVLKHTLMITSFVLIIMLLIEYINVLTRASWQFIKSLPVESAHWHRTIWK